MIFKTLLAYIIFPLYIVGCQKDATVSPVNVSFKMISDKTWYLNYVKEGSILRTYLGQPTYYITFFDDNTTADSDGIKGIFKLSYDGNILKLNVQAQTTNGNSINYTYDVVSIGSNNMVLTFFPINENITTTLYYSIKQ